MNLESFETVIVETDLLILGGGMAACGAAFEASHFARCGIVPSTAENASFCTRLLPAIPGLDLNMPECPALKRGASYCIHSS